LSESFQRDEKMGIYLQIYNLQPDENTQKPNGTIEYEIVRKGTNEKVLEFVEDINAIENASATQVTIEKLLPLRNLEPGQYTLRVKVQDKNKNQVLNQAASFTVTEVRAENRDQTVAKR
jgi:cell division protein YceG involved in septum cleavage